ncbi:MAG: hypothetical protein CL916_06965 [Deltaproteobacteria bacterium]|nr:hypothetical protein [Deltaproteobacteria bacterium]
MVLLFISLLACSDKTVDSGEPGTEDSGSPSLDFIGMDFNLESSQGYELVASGARISFPADSDFSFSAGCNSLGGTFSVESDVFTLGEAYMTEMGCDTALMDEDSWFVSFFQSSPVLAFDGEILTFTGAEATLVFLDSEIATPDQELLGPTWEIDTFIDGDTANAYNLAESPTLSFSADGNVEIFGGCNGGGGSYEVGDDGTISFSELISTEMACDEAVMSAENHLFSVLGETGLAFEIDANRLTIMGASLGVSGSAQE